MRIDVIGQSVHIVDSEELIVRSSVGIYECEFTFDATWDGYDKTAMFSNGRSERTCAIVDGTCTIPSEILKYAGRMTIAVRGALDDDSIQTEWSAPVLIHAGALNAVSSSNPTGNNQFIEDGCMKIDVRGQTAHVLGGSLVVKNSVGIYECEFTFDEAWDGYGKSAVFSNGRSAYTCVIADGRCTVPAAVLKYVGRMAVGVYGVKDNLRMPTVWTEPIVIRGGAFNAESAPDDPEPSVYDQIIELIESGRLVGPPGVSVENVEIVDNHLMVYLSDGTEIDAGEISGGGGGSSSWSAITGKPFATIGAGLKVVGTQLQVDTANAVEEDNTKPITSAAVHVQIGNIESLLSFI